jgi:single-strand DNA-binding protein
MGNLNKVMLIGRIGQDIEKRITPQGKSVATISLATSERFTDSQGQKQEKTEWHRIVLWEKLADLVEQYCKKGSQLYVEGSLQTKEWQDKDGNKRYTTEINGRNMQFLDPPSGAPSSVQPNDQPQPQQPQGPPQPPTPGGTATVQTPGPNGSFVEDDIPF